jgi:predicted ester cyclase
MSIEDTQQAMDAYIEDLLGGGPYRRHFSDDVVVSIVGTDQGAEGPDGVEAWIDYLHKVAFEARPELKNMIVGDGQAVGEFDFVGKHVGEFGGIAATGREVRVPYCMVYELEGEKIRVLRGYMPMDVMMQQLGGGVSSEEQSVEPSH